MNGQPDKKGSIDSSLSGLYSLLTDEKAMNGDVFPGSMETLASDTQRAEVRQGLYRKLHGRGIFTGSYEDFDNYFFNPYSQGNQVAALRDKTFTRDPAKEMARQRALMDASRGEYNPYGTSEVSYRPEVRGLGTNIAPIDLVDSEDTLPEPKTPAGDRPKTTRTFGGGVVSGLRGIHGGAQIAVAELLKMFGGGDSDDEKEAIHLINQMEKDGTLSLDTIQEMRKKLGTRIATYTPAGFIYTPPSGKIARQLDALNLIEERMQRMGQDLTPEKRAVALDAMRSDLSEKGASEDKANPFVRWKEDAKDYIRKSEVPSGTWAELGSATASVGGALAGQAISLIPGVGAPIGQAISWASIGAQTLSSGGQAIMDMEDYAAEKGVYITPEEKATIAIGYMATEFGGDALGGAVASKSISAIGKLAGGRLGQKLAVRSLAKGIAGNEGVRQSLSNLSEYAQKPLAIPLAKSAGRQIVRGAVTEGPGESLTTLAQNGALDRVWKDKEDQEAWADVARQAVKDGIYGAWAGALMGGFGSAIQSGQVARMHRKEGLTLVQDAKNNLYEVIGSDKDQSAYLVLDRAGRQKMLPADQVVDAIHYTPEERQKSQKAYDEATEGLHPKEEVLTENQQRAGAILSATEQQQSPIYRATHPEVAEEELNSPVALAGAKKARADVLEGQNEEVRARVDQMALVQWVGDADPTEELTKLLSDESLSDNDRQSILDVVTAQSRLIALERSHQEAMARMQSELTKEWSAKSVVGDESARGSVISATMTDADGKPKQVYVTGGVRVVTNEDGTVELLPTDDDAPIYVYDESVNGEEKGHIVQMDDLFSPQLVAEDYLDLVQAAVDEADAAFLNEVQQAEEQASQSEEGDAGDAGDTTDDFMQSLPRTREGEVDGLRLMSERPDDFIRYLGQLYGEDFVASLPMSKKGALDLKALTPEQTLKINEAALGKSGAVEAARQRRSQVGAERAKLEAEVKNDLGNLEKRMALRKASEEYRLYDDYVRTAEEQARQELEARRRAEEEALTPEERQRREEEKRQLAQEKKNRDERIRLENERRRREREELERNTEGSTVREYTEDPPRQARTRGARLVNGTVVYRQEPMTVEHYADAERAFSQRPGETRVPVKRTIVEAESLQASHKEGRMNPRHFIPEAQPKDRADNGLSSTAADRIASDIRPDEITGGITAYTGAPVVNGRGEVIQGNNRTDALQTMYDGSERHAKSAERYKEYLKAHASEYGMTAEQVEAMAHPVAVDVAEVSDSEAIRLGHRGQTDLESAGTDTMNAQTVGEELNSDTDPQSGQSMLVSFFNRIFNRTGANGAELSAKMDNMLNRNAEEGLKFLHENGYITDTQYKNAFETNSEGKRVVTAEAKTALKDVALYQLADVIGPRAMDIFYRLPASARNGLATFLYRDSQASFETSLAPDLGDALLVWDSLRQDPDFAGQTNFESAKIFILGKVSLFGRSELETNLGEASSLAKLLAASMQTQTEEQIASVLNNYYDLVGANATGAKTQSLIPTSQPTDTKAGAAEAVYGRVYEVPSGREKHYRFRRDVAEDFRARRDVAEDFRARRDALADRITEERRKRAAAADMARTFGVPLKLHEDMSTLPEEVRAGFDETHFVKGWFYKGDDAVHIYLPANVDADDVRATFLHEAVGHYGCRELLGEVGYNQVLDNLANKLGEEEVLRAMSEYCNGSQDLTDLGQVRIAMDEWIAHRAESGITKRTVWESIKDFFRKVFGLSGKQIDQSAEMMADDLLRRSAENLQKRAERQQSTAPERAEVKSEVRFRARKANGEEVDLPGVSYSDVRDHYGHRFVKASDGSIDFGEIGEETGLTPGKIRLSEGSQSEDTGYGLLHMEREGRKEQILKAGFSSAINFAEYVAKNYTAIFKGKVRPSGKPTYILQAPTSKNNILYVELFPEDGYWDINSGGPFSFTYTKNKEIVWSLPALGHTIVTGGMELSAQQTGDSRSGNSPQTISLDDKGTESSVYNQKDESEKRFRRAERAGDVSGAAEAASDFMRNATPKNTSVDDVLRFLRVYHNSPHLLKKADGAFVDPDTGERLGFDHRFIGNGEGYQAHGWGSYFSVNDLAHYASTNDGDTYDGIKITRNDKYVISKGGDTNTSLILFQAIRMGYRTNTAPQAEDTIAKFVEEKLSELSESQERRLAKQKRLLDALKGNEPWAVTAINSRWGEVITDPKTGYEYDTTYSLEEFEEETYEKIKEEAKEYRDALEFIERNPDYVKNFVSKADRHKYQVEIPDPKTHRYLEEDALLTKEEESRIREAAPDTKRIKYHRLNEERLEGRKVWEVYDLLAKVLNGADKASALLNKAGFVGIHYNGRVDGECYVIFNENDAKITDHYRFRRAEAHLAGVHTLTMDNLRHAMKMGGLANPSIAVYDTERGLPTRTFGEVALIAPRDLVDAKTGRHKGTYNRDAWTPTYPQVSYELTKSGEDALRSLSDKVRDLGDVASARLLMNEANQSDLSPATLETRLRTNEGVRKLYESEHRGEDFDSYVSSLAKSIEMRDFLFAGQRADGSWKRVPHTLDNVSKLMKKESAEGSKAYPFAYALSKLGSRYRSLSAIRKGEDLLSGKDPAKWESTRKEFTDLANELQGEAKSLFDIRGEEHLAALLADGENLFGRPLTVTEEARVSTLREQMKALPTDYFETKVDRPVGLGEFVEAVVPDGTSPELVAELEKSGLKVSTYDSSKDGALNAAVLSAMDRADATDRGVRFRTGELNIEEVNRTFNEQLRQLKEGKLENDHVFMLGIASPILRSAGVTNAPIEMKAQKLLDKSVQENHPFDITDLYDLPRAIQDPIMVFRSKTVTGRFVVLVEQTKGDINYVVALGVEKNASNIEVNDIRSVYPKDRINGVIDWIIGERDLLKYANKKKAYDWLFKQRSNFAEVKEKVARIDLATKVVRDFENPKIENETPTDKELRQSTVNEKQKKDGTQDVVSGSDIRFRATKRAKETIDGWLNKRSDLTEEDKATFYDEIKDLDNKGSLAAGRWFANGRIRLPEDMAKVKQALLVAEQAKVDPIQYDSPMDLINTHSEVKLKSKPIDPETIQTLHRAKSFNNGLVIYDVDDSEESRMNMRAIINTHFGEDASPWCLLQGDGKGNLMPESREYWEHYNAYPKQVAFVEGKLTAFSANDKEEKIWWDRNDESSREIPIANNVRVENDPLERTADKVFDLAKGIITYKNARKGDPSHGNYEEWYDLDHPKRRMDRDEDGCLTRNTVWTPDGYLSSNMERTGNVEKNEHYYPNGELRDRTVLVSDKQQSHEEWNPDGVKWKAEHFTYSEDGYYSVEETWWGDGRRMSKVEYKNGLKDGEAKYWNRNGSYSVGLHHQGSCSGIWKFYSEKGLPLYDVEYIPNGTLEPTMHIVQTYDKEGNPKIMSKENDPSTRFRRAERAADVSGAAEAASDFVRNATPKNTSVDDVLRFLRVYHNSPHLLKKADGAFVDPKTGERLGFDHRFMGSGEGAQAHGWGSYFSVNDLEGYASSPTSKGGFNGMRVKQNDAYVISNGGSTKTAYDLYLTILDYCNRGGANQNEETVKKAVKEHLEGNIKTNEANARVEERLLDALKNNEPWTVAATSTSEVLFVTDPKTGYMFRPSEFSVKEATSRYEKHRSEVDRNKDLLSFVDSNPDYVKHFVTKITRHKYVVEIPDPKTNHYIGEGRPLTKHEGEMIREAINDNPELRQSVLEKMSWRGLTGKEAYERLSLCLGAERASALLNEAGFVGIHYNGQRDGECYVIFNENDAKITDHYRFRRTERADPKSMTAPINPEWDGEWYSPEDLTGKSTADLLDLPAAPATPEKRPTQSVAEYAETMSRHYADPRVRFRTGAHTESLRAPQPPRITEGMSLYEVAQLQHEYNRNYRDYLSSSMKRMDALVTTKGRFIRYMVDSARPVELFCKEMERMGIGMTPEQNVYQDLMTQSSRELNMRKQEVEPLVTKLTDRIRDLREQKLLDKVMDVSYTFTDEDTNETKTIKSADGYDKVSLYFQAKDIVECEQLGLVSRGREGFEAVVTEAGKESNHITPEAYIASFEASVGKANAEALCNDMRKMSRWSIDRLHGAGLMTDDQYRSLTQSPRRYYAPQRGFKVTEESDRNAYERVEMTAEGRQSLSGDPIAYMQAIMNTTVMRVVRNQDLLHLYEWVTQHQEELARRGVLEIGETYYRKAGVDEKGNPIYTPSKQAPTIEELRHDSDARRQVAKLRMEQKRLDQSHDKGETADYVYGIKSKEISNKISDLNNSIEILYRDPEPLRGDEKKQNEALRRTVKVYKDGVEQQIHFSPQYRGELVADVLNGRASVSLGTNLPSIIQKPLNYVSKATRFMSALMTQYNPIFAVKNALRDYGTALNSNVSDFGWGYQRAFMANYAKVQKTVLQYAMSDAYSDGTYPQGKYGTYLKEFFDEGAATGWSFLPDVVKIRQTMKEMSDPSLKQKFVNGKFGVANAFGLKQGIGMITEASELNTRFAEYVTSRERGYSKKEAAKHAKELTVNFNRKGALAGVFGSFFGFWNASIQGTNKIVRLGRHGAEWCGTLFAGGLAQGLLYALGAPDKDDERAFTEWEMMTNICIGDFKIPLPQGFRGFWGAGVQMALALAGKKDWQGSVIDGMQYLIGEILPSEVASLSNVVEWDDVTGNVEFNKTKVLRDIMPTAIQPVTDVRFNMNFMGNPVYREPFIKGQEGQIAQRTLGKKRTKQVYKDLSDKIWYAMGGSLERNDRMSRDGTHILPDDEWLNPSVIEHVFEGYTTGVGRTLADIATCVSAASSGDPSELRKLQIVNDLTKQEKDYSDSDRSYWKLMDFYNSRQQTMSNLRKAKEGEDVERYKKMTERVDAMAPRMTAEQLTEKIWEDGTQDEKLYVTWLETKALIKQLGKGKVTKEEVAPTIDRLTEQFRELR